MMNIDALHGAVPAFLTHRRDAVTSSESMGAR
jgi:hypothetical protein